MQTYFDGEVTVPLYVGNPYQMKFKVRKHEYTLRDSLWYGLETESDHFLTYEKDTVFSIPGEGENIIFVSSFEFDNRVDRYERTLENMVDVLGVIGGIFEIISIGIFFLVGFFVDSIFEFNLSKRLDLARYRDHSIPPAIVRKDTEKVQNLDAKEDEIKHPEESEALNQLSKTDKPATQTQIGSILTRKRTSGPKKK